MASQYFYGQFGHKLPAASVADIVAPTFSGIVSLDPQPNGALLAEWAAASDGTTPVEYLVYIAPGSVDAATLFVSQNLAAITPALSIKLFTQADQSYLSGEYTVGVRAKDAVGNINQNTALLTETSVGVLSDSLAASVIQLNLDTKKIERAANLVMAAAV